MLVLLLEAGQNCDFLVLLAALDSHLLPSHLLPIFLGTPRLQLLDTRAVPCWGWPSGTHFSEVQCERLRGKCELGLSECSHWGLQASKGTVSWRLWILLDAKVVKWIMAELFFVLKIVIFYFYPYVCVCVYMLACAYVLRSQQRPKEGVRCPGPGVTRGCELPKVGVGNWP